MVVCMVTVVLCITCVEVEKDDPETTGSSTQDLDCANSDDLVKDHQAQEPAGMLVFCLGRKLHGLSGIAVYLFGSHATSLFVLKYKTCCV